MVKLWSLLLLVLLLWEQISASMHDKNDNSCEKNDNSCGMNDNSCGVYLAPSTIPNAGLGVFTTRPLQEGDTVGTPGDVCIPILDLKWHMGGRGTDDFFWPLSEYVWNGDAMGMDHESEIRNGVKGFCPGAMDCATNCNLALVNVGKSLPEYNNAGLHRKRDPGAGAITPYLNGTTIVEADIPAGGELFKHYGDSWFISREETFGMVPWEDDYDEVEALVKTFAGRIPSFARRSVWELLLKNPWWKQGSRIMNALPFFDEIDIVANEGIRAIHQPSAIRDQDYLKTNGRCMDVIESGPSTLPQAGRGAFSKRAFQKDSIITGSPLLIILDRSYLNMYDTKFNKEKNKLVRDTNSVVGQQLLLNYCMGHGESKLLLVPYASGVNYINHNQTQANVKIQWAPDGIISHNASYFDLKVREMEGNFQTSLAIDYVALRDIKPGEELFLDYGDEWEKAWNRHLNDWKPPLRSNQYVDASTFNARVKDSAVRTDQEQMLDPYPSNLEVRCHDGLRKKSWQKYIEKDYDTLWKSIDEKGCSCFIDARYEKDGEFLYNIRLEYEMKEDGKWIEKYVEREGVPRSVISFLDKPYTTDIHLSNAFRHDIRIPDEMFPRKWRNDRMVYVQK